MKTVSLSGSLRESVGKKDAKKHRREGNIPCVLYGGKEQIHFTLPVLPFEKTFFSPEVYLINLTIDGVEHQAILQDVQYHPVSDSVLHADFIEVFPGRKVTVSLPILFEGNVPGVMAGGRLIKKMRKITVKGVPAELPEFVTVDMSKMKIGDNIKVKDVTNDKFTMLDNPNAVLVLVKAARGAGELELEEEGEEGAEEETEAATE